MKSITRFALRVRQLFYLLALTLTTLASISFAADVGESAPTISLPLLENQRSGDVTGLEDYRGKLVYLDFWASWCGPCRESLPILNELRASYMTAGFEVVAINVDENLSDALKFLDRYPVDYPVLLDPQGVTPKKYDIMGMPTGYLIDEDGTIIHKHTGFRSNDGKKIEALINEHLLSSYGSN